MLRSFLLFPLLILPFQTYLNAESSQNVWTPELMQKTKRVMEVRPSPKGTRVAFTVSRAVVTPDNGFSIRQIYLAEGGTTRQLTFGDKSSRNAQWSPDGQCLAFLSARSGRNQINLIRMDGGEAEPLTEVSGDLGDYAWSPDGQSIAYSMTDPDTEEEERAVKSKNDARWHQENPKFSRLYVMPLAKDTHGKREPKLLEKFNRDVNVLFTGLQIVKRLFSATVSPPVRMIVTTFIYRLWK